jgi:hypothetical protein
MQSAEFVSVREHLLSISDGRAGPAKLPKASNGQKIMSLPAGRDGVENAIT